ncbi:hypothetical protein CAEBREN_01707 [Caenorhabditis brenneri]|uniref:F-box associated domain-containing protein n=1 Tax=Caenorhabditis brenneri TaxID=135651 RepID=G0MNZ5_CAEBE|nr:hypothetical protein CAEBREN_01707 [Caenorhabditis brenneri]
MNYRDVFLLSLCSKVSVKLIQSVAWREITKISYHSCIDLDRKCWFIRFTCKEGTIIEVIRTYLCEGGSKAVQISISDKNLGSRILSNRRPLVLFSGKNHSESIAVILNQIDVLFGRNAQYTFTHNAYFLSCTNVPIVQSSFYCCDPIDANDLDNHFELIPIQDFVQLSGSTIKGQIRFDSKLLKAKKLHIYVPEKTRKVVIRYFEGQKLFLFYVHITYDQVRRVMKAWKKNKVFRNLDTLELNGFFHEFSSVDDFQEELNVKQIPEQIAPQVFKSTMAAIAPAQLIISKYIVKDDGTVAFLYISDRSVVLSVKKFTEEEMLERNSIDF